MMIMFYCYFNTGGSKSLSSQRPLLLTVRKGSRNSLLYCIMRYCLWLNVCCLASNLHNHKITRGFSFSSTFPNQQWIFHVLQSGKPSLKSIHLTNTLHESLLVIKLTPWIQFLSSCNRLTCYCSNGEMLSEKVILMPVSHLVNGTPLFCLS